MLKLEERQRTALGAQLATAVLEHMLEGMSPTKNNSEMLIYLKSSHH